MAAGALSASLPGTVTAKLLSAGHDFFSAHVTNSFANGKKYVPVMITPYKPNGQIDFNTLSKLIDFYAAAGAKGFFANCASSEMYNLSPDERLSLTKHVVKRAGSKMSVVSTGSFGEKLNEKATFTKKIYDTGVNGVITITSHFAKEDENDETLMENYSAFFKLTDNIPLGTYECPSPYKRILTPEVFSFLLKSGRMVYHKDTTIDFDKVKAKIELAKNTKLEFYDACIANAMYSLQAGAKGMSPICGNLYPEIVSWMCNNATDPQKQEDVKYIQEQLTKTEDLIGQHYPVSAKYFLHKRGLPIELISRSNKDPLTVKQKEVLDGVHKTFLGWCERIGIRPVQV
ncbi:MAG: dihydrodipicolinate synthase family protein [Bacteroidetes bacterium]|nr:dihydrodipicolinate synthase family protein [Bacteroidota bacterium]